MGPRWLRSSLALVVLLATAVPLLGGCGVPVGDSNGIAEPDATARRDGEAAWPPKVSLVRRWEGLDRPVQLTAPAGASGLKFVVCLPGTVEIIENDKVLDTPFLDISEKVSVGGERGLFSIAFAPDYEQSGRFYVCYTDLNGSTVVERYRVSSDEKRADEQTGEVILTVPQPYANHNGGQIAFGPDRFLYVGLGDGGGAGDPEGNGQRTDTLLGKILRIDVSGQGTYAIPPGNPFVGRKGYRGEIWDRGLRNPWRFSFDTLTGDLYIGDAGQDDWEEIDIEPVNTGGLNYGWVLYEGSHPYPPGSKGRSASGLTMPVFEYGHDLGYSVTGGYVYRGSLWPALVGCYFYADYGSGRIWAGQRNGGTWRTAEVADTRRHIAGFGQDAAGELYVLDLDSGEILQLVGR